ncbi:MAG TPA: ABC transporter permease [Candidatus Dormibacteraeota bacterium]|nr:ABC transporter permease [Candidatus Dormibacteraeota bacterium]
MKLTIALRMAFRALGHNKMRTALTMLGVIIGVAAVICTVAIGEGASQRIQTSIANMGANMVWIEAGGVNLRGVRTGNGTTKSLTLDDANAIADQIPLVSHVTPNVDTHAQVVYGNQNWQTQLRGISPNYLYVRKVAVDRGTFFGQEEIDRAANVCVLGRTVSNILFLKADPIGKTIRVENEPCLVIGLLEAKGQSATGQDQDDTILMPYTTVQKKIKGINWLDDIWCSAISQAAIPEAEKEITELLRERHHLRPGEQNDFNIRHPVEFATAMADSAHMMELLLAGIASIALFVGGIGIMNIMLVSVTERTREIGVRMALGATEEAVQLQFLSEAMVMSLVGGLIGLVVGLTGSILIAYVLQWPAVVPVSSMLVAVVFSACIGIFFGYYPARKAASLDPIEALRYE